MNVGQSDKALTYLDKQLKYDKSSFNANSMKMRLYLAEGKTDEAPELCRSIKPPVRERTPHISSR